MGALSDLLACHFEHLPFPFMVIVSTDMSTSSRSKKRRFTRSKRTKDKILRGVGLNGAASYQEMRTAKSLIQPIGSYPFTLTGLRWNICATLRWDADEVDAGNRYAKIVWVMAIVKAGTDTTSIMSAGYPNLDTIYKPEENAIAWGYGVLRNNINGNYLSWTDHTKSMRKMKMGDSLAVFMFVRSAGYPIPEEGKDPVSDTINIDFEAQWFQLS